MASRHTLSLLMPALLPGGDDFAMNARRTSENSVTAKFGCAPPRSAYLRRDRNTSGRYCRSLMYDRLRTSDPLHKKTGSPGCGWTLGPNCASNFSRSPYVATRNRSQQIHATDVASMLPIGNKNPAWPRPDALSPARTGELATANFVEFRL